ncbi:hypothetical protein WP3W18E06_18340 [Raoultella ornithinolytica]|nr:hypothetical protein WP3W18E06_18340 [Raoultella ornithinolytica]
MAKQVWKRPGEWRCWSCKEWVSNIELSNADGFCPHCDQEIDTQDTPYTDVDRPEGANQ